MLADTDISADTDMILIGLSVGLPLIEVIVQPLAYLHFSLLYFPIFREHYAAQALPPNTSVFW